MAEVTNEEANDLADEILGRAEFVAAGEPGFFERTINRVLDEIGEVLGRIFGAIFGGAGGAAGTTIATILLVLFGLLIIYAIYRAWAGRAPKEDVDTNEARIVFDEVVEPEALRSDLARYASEQNWREAVIAGFRLAIVELIEANIAREISGATTGDFARAVEARRPSLLESYRPAAWAFERAFYSKSKIRQSDLAAVQTLLDQIATSSPEPALS